MQTILRDWLGPGRVVARRMRSSPARDQLLGQENGRVENLRPICRLGLMSRWRKKCGQESIPRQKQFQGYFGQGNLARNGWGPRVDGGMWAAA